MLQLITVLVIAALIAVDQLIKFAVLEHLAPIGSYCLIDRVLSLTYIENTGAAFGSLSSHTALLSAFTAVVLVVGLIYLLTGKSISKLAYVCITAIIAGGAANLIDRVFKGYVIDYIEPLFVKFAVFNFADILVTCGAIILIIRLIYDIVKQAEEDKAKKGESADE